MTSRGNGLLGHVSYNYYVFLFHYTSCNDYLNLTCIWQYNVAVCFCLCTHCLMDSPNPSLRPIWSVAVIAIYSMWRLHDSWWMAWVYVYPYTGTITRPPDTIWRPRLFFPSALGLYLFPIWSLLGVFRDSSMSVDHVHVASLRRADATSFMHARWGGYTRAHGSGGQSRIQSASPPSHTQLLPI